MDKIIPKNNSKLSKMWITIINLENSLFPEIKEQFGVF